MKLPRARLSCDGFTLMEALVVVVLIIALWVLFSADFARAPQSAMSIRCTGNQRQIAIGLMIWQSDHTNQFPWQVSCTNIGAMEPALAGNAAAVFDVILPCVGATKCFVCPTDVLRTVATNQAKLFNRNISYFVGLDRGTNATAGILTGDRHLMAGRTPVQSGLFEYTNSLTMGWTRELHNGNPNTTMGIMSFYDGHAELVKEARINSIFKQTGLDTGRFDIP